MKKYILIISCLAAVAPMGIARQLTVEEAMSRVSARHAVRSKMPKADVRPVYVSESAGVKGAYVLSAPDGGFVVLAADDRAPAVLGYSDAPLDPASELPENFRWWLGEYARQIAAAPQDAPAAVEVRTAGNAKTDIEPMLKTRWDQGSPYWDKCPKEGNRQCYTGCVATALAQVMNWHRWPEKPVGSVVYTSKNNGYLSMDYTDITFEWDKMLDTYSASSPQESKDAVATLMKAVGYGAHMNYSYAGSGASSYIAGQALINNFGYDRGLSLQQRQWYSIDEWADLVYKEMTTNGPVYYDGSGTGGGHAFVCDGYRAADGMFHFNWGWSGQSDGWFVLSALNPGEQGAGGVSPGYNWSQDIFVGLKKADDSSELHYEFAPYAGLRSPMTDYDYVELGEHFTMLGYETSDGFCNYSIMRADNVTFGAQFLDTATGKSTYIKDKSLVDFSIEAYTRKTLLYITMPTDFPEGNYEVRPAYKVGADGEWRAMRECAAFRNYFTARVEDGKMYLDRPAPKAMLKVEVSDIPEYFTSSSEFTVKLNIKDVGTADYAGVLVGVFMNFVNDEPKIVAQCDSYDITLRAGESREVEYSSCVRTGSLTDGEYYFCIGNTVNGEIVSDLYPVKVGNRYGALKMSVYGLKVADNDFLFCDDVRVSANVSCEEGTYADKLALLISKEKLDFKPIAVVESEEVFNMTAVESREISFSGQFFGAEDGESYYATLGCRGADGAWVPLTETYLTLTVADKTTHGSGSGVEVVRSEDYDSVKAFTVTGYPVDLNSVAPGVYILVTTSSDGLRRVEKIRK